jgi:site-specific recombinase XerC
MADAAHQELLTGFLAHLGNERHYSELTLENYARDLRKLFQLVADTPLASLKSHHIRRYIAQLHGQGLGGRSLARMLSAWRGFFNYLMRDHAFRDNPCIGLRPPKAPKLLPHALSPDEAVRLVDLPAQTPPDLRDKAMFELLYSSGLRLAELVSLECSAMRSDLASGEVRVTGKGSKTRIVPMGSQAISALRAWMDVRNSIAKPEERTASAFPHAQCSCSCASGASSKALRAACIHTCCAIPSPPMYCNPRATCAQCRRCSATQASPLRRFTHTSIFSTSPKSMMARIRARKRNEQ